MARLISLELGSAKVVPGKGNGRLAEEREARSFAILSFRRKRNLHLSRERYPQGLGTTSPKTALTPTNALRILKTFKVAWEQKTKAFRLTQQW